MVALARPDNEIMLYSSRSNEWYTPARYAEVIRELLGTIDVDPASNALANQVIQATTYYDVQSNGLDKEWHGRVFLNPPYGYDGATRQKGNVGVWINKLVEQYTAGIVTEAVLLVNATTEKRWFDPLWQYPICFARVRISFWNAQGESGRPTHGNALVYFGKNTARFIQVFDKIGPIVNLARVPHMENPLTLWDDSL